MSQRPARAVAMICLLTPDEVEGGVARVEAQRALEDGLAVVVHLALQVQEINDETPV